jgi:hypothetical protein
LDYVNKIDVATGILAPIALSAVTIAGDGLSFTISGAVSGELYDYDYFYDTSLSTLAEITESHAINRAAQGDETAQAVNDLNKKVEESNILQQEEIDNKIDKSILIAQGDIIYASAANTPARLAKGSALQEIRMNAGATAPEWYTPVTPVQIAKGNFVDQSTTIAANSTYTKTISLGFNATRGRLIIKGNDSYSKGIIIFFDTSSTNSIAFAAQAGSTFYARSVNSRLVTAEANFISDNSVACGIDDCYINGSNLIIIFRNGDGGTNSTLKVRCQWEVEG